MSESISSASVFTIVITLIGICATVLMSSLAYSKTFKIKNRVVEIIEKHRKYDDGVVKNEIDELLKNSGYPAIGGSDSCPAGRGNSNVPGTDASVTGGVAINNLDNYRYCIYQYDTVKGTYYSVAVYMKIQLPLIGDVVNIQFPIYGETKVFNDF